MKKPAINKNSKFMQGIYSPKNPKKYIGDVSDIKYRSSWEYAFIRYCDSNPSIARWNSEGIVIKYVCPVDNKVRSYYVDFIIEYVDTKGDMKRALIEVKPHKQTQPPVPPKKKSKYYINEVLTYHTNMAKWKTAIDFCNKNSMDFVVLTEKGAINLTKGSLAQELILENLEGFK